MSKKMIDQMVVGKIYSNAEIAKIFEVATQGGMRRSLANKCLVLISDEIDNPYPDSWNGDILNYSGQGTIGDQDINYMQNKTLAQSRENGVTVHLVVKVEPNNFVYYGVVQLADEPYIDYDGKRKIVVFPIEITESKDELHKWNKKVNDLSTSAQREKLRKYSNKKLLDTVYQYQKISKQRTLTRPITVNTFRRNQSLVELVKRFADGKCQLCEKEAPFKDHSGAPFLEVHYIKWLSKGGFDSIDNVAAVCPNCHRKMHQIADPNDVRKLKDKANESLRKIQDWGKRSIQDQH